MFTVSTARSVYRSVLQLQFLLLILPVCNGFNVPQQILFSSRQLKQDSRSSLLAVTNPESTTTGVPSPPPRRTGFGQKVLDFALETPLWKHILVPRARANIAKTAEANNVPWSSAKEWIQSKVNEETNPNPMKDLKPQDIPEYYRTSAFHAYEEGNLNWDAAWDVELASCAVGARNFPKYGSKGEEAFRGAFAQALKDAGATIPSKGGVSILDMGCGSGMSTRRIAQQFPQATKIVGMDLSPYFIAVGKRLLDLAPIESFHNGGPWVSTIVPDDRIEYQVGDVANTRFDDNTFDVVNLQFVLHELPTSAAFQVIDEAARILKKDGGQFWICEMDYESPYQAEVRANPLVFSLIRSTEPFLDDYAESIPQLLLYLQAKFDSITVVAATGRHFALVATLNGQSESEDEEGNKKQGIMTDLRFNDDGTYRLKDTHLRAWESKDEGALNA